GPQRSADPPAPNTPQRWIIVHALILKSAVNRASTYISLLCKWDIPAKIFIITDLPAALQNGAAFLCRISETAQRPLYFSLDVPLQDGVIIQFRLLIALSIQHWDRRGHKGSYGQSAAAYALHNGRMPAL
ncbi:Metallopeptidase family protein, partial [Dysosmobacter welbionis]